MIRFLSFAGKVIVAHTVTYFVAGALAYQLLMKEFYVGTDPILATFMRTEAEPELWRHVMTWFIPAQILRGLLMACALHPFFDTLAQWSFRKRWLSMAGVYLVFGCWSATGAAPGTIEGLVYLRPEITLQAHLTGQVELLGQGLALGAWVAWWMGRKPREQTPVGV